jgi:hypothetical protein
MAIRAISGSVSGDLKVSGYRVLEVSGYRVLEVSGYRVLEVSRLPRS